MMGCSFCSHRKFWRGTWRGRTPEVVIEEIRELVNVYQVEFITMIDPYPTCDRERWEHLLDLLIAEAMPVKILMETRVEDIARDADILHKYHAAGVIHLYLGLEASTDEMLASLNKGTDMDMNQRALDLARENDLTTEASFMIGAPTETWESVEKTIEVAIRLNPDIAVFPVITPMPFTPIHEEYKDRIRVTDWSQYNLATPIVEPYEMTIDEVNQALAKCYMEFYRHKAKEVLALPDGFKRRYMLSAFKEMMAGYSDQFTALGITMPMLPDGMLAPHHQ
jgi:anaerobic magnesium-protoporphyrin IX monomethyl ester cyclase